jgi:hypothetical protein
VADEVQLYRLSVEETFQELKADGMELASAFFTKVNDYRHTHPVRERHADRYGGYIGYCFA